MFDFVCRGIGSLVATARGRQTAAASIGSRNGRVLGKRTRIPTGDRVRRSRCSVSFSSLETADTSLASLYCVSIENDGKKKDLFWCTQASS